MIRSVFLTVVMAANLVVAQPTIQNHERVGHEHHDHHHMSVNSPEDAPIKITINPEARVSVARGGNLPPAVACGQPLELPVKIVNQGFVTAPLEARLVDSVPEGVSVEFPAEPLKGIKEERRILRLTLKEPGQLDITVAFRTRNNIADLGGRDRVHLLVRCENPLAG